MTPRLWPRASVAVLAVCLGQACGRPGGSSDYAAAVSREVERRIVPPGVTGVTLGPAEMKPCAIQTEWTFATPWTRARYGEWLKAKLSPDFTVLNESPRALTFSRYVGGDARSLLVETRPGADSLRIQGTLCVFPD